MRNLHRRTPIAVVAGLVVAFVVAFVAACGSDPTGAVPASPATGVYALKTINGSTLPATYQSTPEVTVFLADTLTLGPSGGYKEVVLSQTAPPGQAPTKTDTAVYTGSWVDAGATISLVGLGNATLTGGDTLTRVVGGNQGQNGGTTTLVYVK